MIREIGLRRDQQSPYVVTQFSSGETTPRFNDFCDVLRAICWNWSQFGVSVSLLVSIAIPCYSSHESSIHILVFLSPLLRRFLLSLLQRPYDGWLAFHCVVLYRETDRCDKKKFSTYSDAKNRRLRRRSYCWHRINLSISSWCRRFKISRVVFVSLRAHFDFTLYTEVTYALLRIVIARMRMETLYILLTSLSHYGVSNFNHSIENLFSMKTLFARCDACDEISRPARVFHLCCKIPTTPRRGKKRTREGTRAKKKSRNDWMCGRGTAVDDGPVWAWRRA